MCNFGELVLFSLNKPSGIVVDFGLEFGESFDPAVSDTFDKLQYSYSYRLPRTPSKHPAVLVESVKDGKRQKIVVMHERNEDEVASAIVDCISTGTKEMAQNVVLIGTNPMNPDSIKSKLEGVFKDIQIYVAPSRELVTWEGASLFAASTFLDPAFYTKDYVPYKSSAPTGTWTTRDLYIKNQREKLDYFFLKVRAEEEKKAEMQARQGKCNVS